MRHRFLLSSVLVAFVAISPIAARAEVVTIDGTVKAVDAKKRTITVEIGAKTLTLDVSRKAQISVDGKDGSLDSLKSGQKVSISYHDKLEVVLKIVTLGIGANGWRFYDVHGKGILPEDAIVVTRDGGLLCRGSIPAICLTTQQQFEQLKLRLEFRFFQKDVKGNPFISVGSTLPNPKATNAEKFPAGFEVKIRNDNIGQMLLPTRDFKADLPFGQLRDGRRIAPLRQPEYKPDEWTLLEISADEHRNVTVTINGTTVNAIGKAASTRGHFVIFPASNELEVRNVLVTVDGVESKMRFDSIINASR